MKALTTTNRERRARHKKEDKEFGDKTFTFDDVDSPSNLVMHDIVFKCIP